MHNKSSVTTYRINNNQYGPIWNLIIVIGFSALSLRPRPILACCRYICISVCLCQKLLFKAGKNPWTGDLKWRNYVVCPAEGDPHLLRNEYWKIFWKYIKYYCFKGPALCVCVFVFVPLRPPAAAAAGWAQTGAGGPSKWAPWWRWSGRASAARWPISATRSLPPENGWESSWMRLKARTTALCRASATSPARRIMGYLWDSHR